MNESILTLGIVTVFLLLVWSYERRIERLETILLQITGDDSFEAHLASTPGLRSTDNVLPFAQHEVEHWN